MTSLPGAPRYLPQAHPLHRGRPLIDWDLVMVMEPSTILGALVGGYINKASHGVLFWRWLERLWCGLSLAFRSIVV